MRTAETLQTYHTYVHILRNTTCIRKPQVIWGGGGGEFAKCLVGEVV